jgi:hypothetical protein
MQPVAEVLPFVEQLVDVVRVAGAAAVRDRGPDEGGRAHGFLAYAAQRVDDGHGEPDDGVVGVQDDEFERGHLVQGYALDAGEDHRGHRLRLDLREHAVHTQLVAAELLRTHGDGDAGGCRAVRSPEVFVGHPHPATIPAASWPELVRPAVRVVHTVHTRGRLDPLRFAL